MSTATALAHSVMGQENGSRVVLLNPMGSSALAWVRVAGELARKYQVVQMDYPGFGATPNQEAASIAELAQRASATLKQLPPKPAHLVGYSLGGWVAQQMALQAEVEVASLLLIGSADRIYPMGMRMLEQWLQLIDVAGIEATLAEIAFWNFSAASFEKVPDLLQRFVRGGLASFGDTEIFKHQMRLCHAYSTRPPLERITAPTLVARGELDFFYPQFCSQALADAIPGSRMVEIAQTAHAVLWENPEAVARLACEFVGELEREP